MKKFFALFCVAAALTIVAGCAKNEPAPPSTPSASEQPAGEEEVVVEETVEEEKP